MTPSDLEYRQELERVTGLAALEWYAIGADIDLPGPPCGPETIDAAREHLDSACESLASWHIAYHAGFDDGKNACDTP